MPALTDQAPWDDYAARVAELYPPLAAGDGYDEGEVVAAEARLGLRLPRVLREFYLLAGRRDDVTRHLTQPIPPGFLTVADHALVITDGDIDFPVNGILQGELGHDDPSVVRAEGEGLALDWTEDHERFSTWLASMLYWVAVRGGLPFRGAAPVDETEIPAVHARWPKVDLLGSLWEHRIVFHRAGQVICIEGRAPDLTLHAAGRTREDFEEITRVLQLDWTSPADEDAA